MSGKKIIQRKGLRLAKSDVESPRCPCGYHDDMGAKRRVVHLDYLATHFSTAGGLVAHLDEQRKQGNKDYIHYLIADLIMSRYEEREVKPEVIIARSEEMLVELKNATEASTLPDDSNYDGMNEILQDIRGCFPKTLEGDIRRARRNK